MLDTYRSRNRCPGKPRRTALQILPIAGLMGLSLASETIAQKAIADGQTKIDGINVGTAVAAQWLAHFRPIALTSDAWGRDFDRTKNYGAHDGSLRTPEQTEIGPFWTDNAATPYSAAFRGLVARQGRDTAAAARLGAMSSVALSDSVTACFSAKYHYARWRPLTAIRNGDTDGNPGTVADPKGRQPPGPNGRDLHARTQVPAQGRIGT